MARAGVWYCWRWPGGCQQGLCRSFITDERYFSDDGLTGYDVGYDLSEKNLSFIRCQNGSSDSVWGILTGHGTISFTNGNANDIVDTALLIAMAWSIFILSGLGISVLYVLFRHGEATKVTSYMYLVPAVTALMAWLMFGEQFTLTAVAGMLIALVGVALVVRPSR